MLPAAAVYGNELEVLYSRLGKVLLCPANSAMPWVYCYLHANDGELTF